MSNEKMRVLDLLESGKISAEDAAKLIEALGHNYNFMSKDTRENVEERLQSFGKEVSKFAKELGCKMQELYTDLEPKVKKVSKDALEKCASTLDKWAHDVGDSIEKAECCDDKECCGDDKVKDKTDKPNKN